MIREIIKNQHQKEKPLEIKKKLMEEEALLGRKQNHPHLKERVLLKADLVKIEKQELDANSFFLIQNP